MKTLKHFIRVAILCIPTLVLAQADVTQSLKNVGDEVYGGDPADLRLVIGNVVQIILGFVGIVFLILIIWGGIQWMTSGGNEQKIADAKKRIMNATIGLVIIVMAYSIASFVVNSIGQALSE